MTREEYLTYRNAGSTYPAFFYYIERCNKNCLQMPDFFRLFEIWPESWQAMEKVYRYYDIQFEITAVQDLSTKKIIRYL